MKRKNIILGLIVLAVIFIAGGIWLYQWVFGGTQSPSGSLTAIPIETGIVSQSTGQGTQQLSGGAFTPQAASQAYPAPSAASNSTQPEPYPGVGAGSNPVAGQLIFQIAQDQAEARFIIHEELRGQPKEVIGATNQVAGEVAVNLADLSASQVGVIKVDARALQTDDNQRNQVIRNRILHTDTYEFITFKPTSISGLSGSATPGQKFNFQIAGDLTIQDVTRPVVFEVSGQVETLEKLSGTASTIIKRADFNLVIPSVPFVANPGEDVRIEIDLVLLPIS